MKYENTFKAIDQILWKEQGCGSELDYLEQKSWMLFLKYLDDLETEREDEAELEGKSYKRLVSGFYRWSQWATPKKKDPQTGKMVLDTVNAMSGEDLVDFVDQKLFPYLKDFQNTAASTDTLEYKIGEIFGELHNKIRSGFNMREIINMIDELHFQSAEDKHEMTVLYESNIQRMGNAGRNGGEYYTPRPLIRSIIKVVNPKIGETVYDPACGSAGFLCEAFLYMKEKIKSVKDHDILQKETFYGKEKKGLPYIIATMNMIFHGVSAPNITHGNTLAMNLSQIQESDRKNVILANPPFGGNERGEVLQNFEIRSSETAYMFMQHFIKMLKAGGRAGIVIKNTFLNNGDAIAVRKMLLENCNLHTILDLPSGVFTGTGQKTVVLFFTKGEPTEKIWYYQVDKHFTKTQPLTEADMEEFVTLQKTQPESDHSWTLDVSTLDDACDLSVNNPNKVENRDERSAFEIASSLLSQLEEAYKHFNVALKNKLSPKEDWAYKKLGEVVSFISGYTPGKEEIFNQGKYPYFKVAEMNIAGNELFMKNTSLYLNSPKKIYPKGSIIFPKNGGAIFTEKKRILEVDSVIDLNTEAIFPNAQVIKLMYLFYLLTFTKISSFDKGGGLPSLDLKKMSEYIIPVPPLSEQQSIVDYLDALFSKVEALKRNLNQSLAECDALKQAILRQVFE
jgi:type I restriction enzyme M protein